MVIYRVAVGGLHCRSSVELVNLKIGALKGVEASSLSIDGLLRVFADADLIASDDIVRTLIEAGMVPDDVVTASSVILDAQEVEPTSVAVTEPIEVAVPVAAAESAPVAVEQPVLAVAASGVLAAHPVSRFSAEPENFEASDHPGGAFVVQPDSVESLEASVTAVQSPVSPRASLVQRIHVDVSDDYYPSHIEVIPGVPVDIEFGEGHGCLSHVIFEQFGIDEDLTSGGAVVHLPGLAPGTYGFSCGMHMVFGAVVASV
jgi:hypothetical protein